MSRERIKKIPIIVDYSEALTYQLSDHWTIEQILDDIIANLENEIGLPIDNFKINLNGPNWVIRYYPPTVIQIEDDTGARYLDAQSKSNPLYSFKLGQHLYDSVVSGDVFDIDFVEDMNTYEEEYDNEEYANF